MEIIFYTICVESYHLRNYFCAVFQVWQSAWIIGKIKDNIPKSIMEDERDFGSSWLAWSSDSLSVVLTPQHSPKLVRNAPPQTRWIKHSGTGPQPPIPAPRENDTCSSLRTLRLPPGLMRPRERDHILRSPQQNVGLWQQGRCVWHRVSSQMLQGDRERLEASREMTSDSASRMGRISQDRKGHFKTWKQNERKTSYSSFSSEPLNWLGFICCRWSKTSFPLMSI